jgi:hypothetical protein
MAHARVGSIPIELRYRRHVRSAPDSDRTADITRGPVCAQQRKSFDPHRHRRTLAATIIRATRLAAILLRIAQDLRHAEKGLPRL